MLSTFRDTVVKWQMWLSGKARTNEIKMFSTVGFMHFTYPFSTHSFDVDKHSLSLSVGRFMRIDCTCISFTVGNDVNWGFLQVTLQWMSNVEWACHQPPEPIFLAIFHSKLRKKARCTLCCTGRNITSGRECFCFKVNRETKTSS